MAVSGVLCMVLVAAAAAAAASAAAASAATASDSLSTRLEALEAARQEDRAELRRLRARLGDRDRLQDGLSQLRHELQQLSRHVRGEAAVRDGMVELRAEIDSISNEIHVVKSRPAPSLLPSVSATADHTVVLWLRDTVTSLQAQLTELAESANATQLLQLRQEASVRFDQVQQEMRRLEEQQQKLRAQHETERSELAQQRADLADLLTSVQHQQNTYTSLLSEVATLRHELLLGADAAPSVSDHWRRHRRGHRRRHGDRFGQRVLTDVVEVLYGKQLRLDDQQLAAERNQTALRTQQRTQADRLEQLELRVERAEREARQLSWRLNATDGSGAASALKQSTSVLIQEVEQLETKLDRKMSAVQSELARLDVSGSQLATSVSDLQQRQAGLPEHANTLSQQVAALSQQQLVARSQLMALQSDLLTLSLDRPSSSDPTPAADTDSRLNT